ncbi:UNVERIFIED_CONTAM: hypothetical protein FKN15_052637 [Acipenser sinensis]
MEEADGAGPANNEPHEEADKRGQSCSDRGDTGGFGMKIDSVALRGLKEGPDTYGCGDRTLTNLARINITTLPVDLKPINLAALTDETGNSSSTDLNADVEKQHFLPLTNTEEQQEVMDTAAGGNKTDLKNKYPDTLWDTLHQSRKLCFKSKGLTRSFQHNASIDNLSVSPQTNCDGQHKVLNTLSEHHNSVSKTTGDADFRTSCHVLDGLDESQASFTKKNNNTCYSCITASKLGTLSASSADMTMVNATDIIQNCEYRSEFRVGDYKENTNNVKRVGLDRVSSQESACEESQIGPTLPGAAQSTECNLSAEVIINGTKAVSLEDAISDPRTESNNSVNVEEEMVEILEDSRSLLEIFHASSGAVNDQDDLNYELQQGYRILNGFLLEKHRSLTTPFMNPVSKKDFGDYTSRIQEPMWLRRMEQKFINREYETITDFVGDFRLMLENCYRYHGVDHWLSKQAQKLEMMLEQKLTLLSRPLRGKTALAMTSKGRYGSEDEKGLVSTSTRRRTTPRNLGAIATGASESIMVQALRLEEQQRAKDERRQREQERKETEEATAKELEEWERSLLAQAYPQPMDALWEVPAIGHFLCLAQQALKLPEIIFYELERFLLMPRCSVFLAKVMTSLLSHPQQRPTLHRRPALSYRSWEAALRQSVQRWYVAVGQAEDQRACAEQLGLCPQFFRVLGEVSPLEEKPFHLLPFYQRVWLLKGLCDWVYETQKEVQDAVLNQPIHECRESILGYDGQENAYIHFPHFCGADLRIYCQSPSASPEFPLPIRVKRLQSEHTRQEQQAAFGGPSPESNVKRNKRMVQEDPGCGSDSGKGGENDTRQNHLGHTGHTGVTQTREVTDKQYGGSSEGEGCGNGVSEGVRRIITEWGDRKGSASDEGSLSGDRDTVFTGEESLKRIKMEGGDITAIKEGKGCSISPKREGSLKAQVPDSNLCTKWGVAVGEAERNCEAKCRESLPPCWENQEKPSSPRKIVDFGAPLSPGEIRIQDNGIPPSTQGPCRACGTFPANESHENKPHSCPAPSAMKRASPEHSVPESQTEGKAGRMRTKKKKKKKKKVKEAVSNEGKARPGRLRQNLALCSRPDLQQTVVAKKAKHKKHKSALVITVLLTSLGKKSDSKKITVKKRKPCLQLPFEPRFQLVCTNVEELRALIRKTEEELKEFKNMRKKSGKWYFRRQAVKELHCTLVRLLNELLPWEPKLIKAFQRNRARLKKDFDDFKRHPDHDNFVREVWTGEEGNGNLGRDTSSTETNRPSDGAEKQEVLKKELKGMEDSMQQGLELPAGRNRPLRSVCQEGLKLQPKNPKRRQSSSTDDELTPKKRTKLGINEDHVAALAETPLSNLKPATEPPATETFKVLPVFTKGDKPIQALLAKNVGNKVTLISQLPVTSSQTSNKVAVVPQEKTLTAGQAPAKNPLQMLYKMPDNSCVPFDLLGDRGSGSVKIARQPVLDQKTGEKVLQKVVILPRNLLLHHKHLEMETKQNQPSTTPKKASPGSFFDSFGTVQLDDLSKIPVQQVAPLSEVPRTEPAGISPKPNYLGASSSKFAAGQSSAQTPSSSRAVAASVSAAETSKSSDSMQELKTVCIRDSQSILVTTRGGNTGIVKEAPLSKALKEDITLIKAASLRSLPAVKMESDTAVRRNRGYRAANNPSDRDENSGAKSLDSDQKTDSSSCSDEIKKKPVSLSLLEESNGAVLLVFFLLALWGLVHLSLRQLVVGASTGEFNAVRARKHLEHITAVGPRTVGSPENEILTVNYLLEEIEKIKAGSNKAHTISVDVQKPTGSFTIDFLGGFTSYYDRVSNVVVKLEPKRGAKHAMLANCHFDSVANSPGASDDAVSCSVLLEALHSMSNLSTPLRHAVIFLFNGAEENILQASHGFITQHPWAKLVRAFINLEAAGVGGKEIVFQTGIDLAFIENGYLYHTKYDTADRILTDTIQRAGVVYMRSLVYAIGVTLMSWFITLVSVLIIAVLISLTGQSMFWYTHYYVSVCLYGTAGIAMLMLIHTLAKNHYYGNMNQLQVGEMYFDATLTLWCCALVYLTQQGLCSAYVPMITVVFPLITKLLLRQEIKQRGATVKYTALYLLGLSLPYVHFMFLMWVVFEIFTPILGRSGTEIPPDVVLASITAGCIIILSSYFIHFIYLSKSMKRTLVVLASIFGVVAVLVSCGMFFPYSCDSASPRPKRIFLQHTTRTFHDLSGEVIKKDSGIWINGFDYTGMKYVTPHIPEINDTIRAPCDKQVPFCGFPWFLPVEFLVKKNWYLPAPEVFPKTPFEFALLSKQQTDWGTTKLSFEVKGPSHMSLYLLPRHGAALTSWSFGDGTPQFDLGGEYFIFYSHGLDAPAWRFWFEVQAPKSNSGEEMISIGIASHYFFGEDQKTPQLMELLHRFPDWSFPSHWVSTYNLYQY